MNMIYIILHFYYIMSTVSLAPPPRKGFFQPTPTSSVNATRDEELMDSEEVAWLAILVVSIAVFVYTFLKRKT